MRPAGLEAAALLPPGGRPAFLCPVLVKKGSTKRKSTEFRPMLSEHDITTAVNSMREAAASEPSESADVVVVAPLFSHNSCHSLYSTRTPAPEPALSLPPSMVAGGREAALSELSSRLAPRCAKHDLPDHVQSGRRDTSTLYTRSLYASERAKVGSCPGAGDKKLTKDILSILG